MKNIKIIFVLTSVFCITLGIIINAQSNPPKEYVLDENSRKIAEALWNDTAAGYFLDEDMKKVLIETLNDMWNYVPPKGYVPDAETAKKIAEAIWISAYGEMILEKKPYKTYLKRDSIWVVKGSLPKDSYIVEDGDTIPVYTIGGAPYIEIQKSDGKVLKMSHGK